MMLYFRMLLTIGVSLYTSRIVLNTLGIVDFGIYNVVGGVVMMFSFLNSSMASATQRFLSFEIGRNNYTQLNKVFSMSINIHGIIAISILILAETIGLWFLNSKLKIPVERIVAANWVYQFSVLSFMVTVLSVPYNAIIIAHERMKIYAYVSIIEVALKLTTVFALVWFGYDKLKMYAIVVFCVSVIIWIIYKLYCRYSFAENRYIFSWDKSLYKTLMNYACWNLFGNVAYVALGQGVNILLNLFFGPAINAARGIAYQVNGALTGFVSNFQMSMNPQIVKSYASNNQRYMRQLIFQGSKYSFYLLFFLSFPILLQTKTILNWWLNIVPDYAVLFCQLILVDRLINCISGPLMTAAQATGKIKAYQIFEGGLLLIILPLSYLFLKLGYSPQITFYITIILSLIGLFVRLSILSTLMSFSSIAFMQQVLFRIVLVTTLSFVLTLVTIHTFDKLPNQFFISSVISAISVVLTVYLFGLKKQERVFLKDKMGRVFKM